MSPLFSVVVFNVDGAVSLFLDHCPKRRHLSLRNNKLFVQGRFFPICYACRLHCKISLIKSGSQYQLAS